MELPLSDKVRLFIVIMGFLIIVIILVLVIRLAQKLNPQAYTIRNRGKRLLSQSMLVEQKQSEEQFEALKSAITLSMNFRNIVRRLITEFSGLAQLYEEKNKFTGSDLEDLNIIKKKLDIENKNLQQFLITKSKDLSISSKAFINELNIIVEEYVKIVQNFLGQHATDSELVPYLVHCLDEVNEKQKNLGKIHESLIKEFQQLNTEH